MEVPTSVATGRLSRARRRADLLVSVRAVTARGLSVAASLFLTVVVARVLPPVEAGAFFVILAWVTGAATLGRMGTDNMVLKWVAAGRAPEGADPRDLLLLCAGASVAVALPFLGIASWVLSGHVPASSIGIAAAAAAATVVPAALSVTASAALRGAGRIATGTIAELGSAQAIAAALILMTSVASRVSLLNVIVAFLAGHLVTALWSFVTATRVLPRRQAPARPFHAGRAHRAPLLSMMGTSLMFYLLTWSPVLILGAVSTTDQVAHYNAAARVAAFVSLIPVIQASYLTPQFARLFSQGNVEALTRLARATTTRGTLIGLAITVPIALLPGQALRLFGEDYGAAGTALRILALATLLVTAFGPVNGLMLTTGMEHRALALNGALLATTAGAMFLVAPGSGSTGVAIAGAVGSVAYAAAAALLVRERVGVVSHFALGSLRAPAATVDDAPSADDEAPRRRVLVVAGAFAVPGGDPWLIDDLVEALRKDAARIDVVVYDALQPRPHGLQSDDGQVRVLSVGARTATPRGPRRMVAHLAGAVRLHTATRGFVRGEPYDVGLYFSPGVMSAGLPARLRRTGRVRHLTFVLWDFFPIHHAQIGRVSDGLVASLLKRIERLTIARADTVAVMSPASEAFLRSYHRGLGAEVVVVPPWGGAGSVRFDEPKYDDFTVVFGGQLTAGRGVETLVEAAEVLQEAQVAARILVIGSGPDRERLEQDAASRHLNNLEFHDRMSRAAYLRTIARAHAGLAVTVPQVTIPSFPSKIVDYCRVGLPVIACLERTSDVGALIETGRRRPDRDGRGRHRGRGG